MPFIWMPDPTPQQQPYYGMPYPPSSAGSNAESEALKVAKAIIKKDKADKKAKAEKDKKEADSKKPKMFTLLEVTGIVALMSIPLTMLQLSAITTIQTWFQLLTNGSHP